MDNRKQQGGQTGQTSQNHTMGQGNQRGSSQIEGNFSQDQNKGQSGSTQNRGRSGQGGSSSAEETAE